MKIRAMYRFHDEYPWEKGWLIDLKLNNGKKEYTFIEEETGMLIVYEEDEKGLDDFRVIDEEYILDTTQDELNEWYKRTK